MIIVNQNNGLNVFVLNSWQLRIKHIFTRIFFSTFDHQALFIGLYYIDLYKNLNFGPVFRDFQKAIFENLKTSIIQLFFA